MQRHWALLRLGESLQSVQSHYPPLKKWPTVMEPNGGLVRIEVEGGAAKGLPPEIESFRLGFKKGRVAMIQVVFTQAQSRKKPLETLVREFSLRYGEPSRRGLSYSWRDERTALRVFNDEFPSRGAVELRTSVEILDRR